MCWLKRAPLTSAPRTQPAWPRRGGSAFGLFGRRGHGELATLRSQELNGRFKRPARRSSSRRRRQPVGWLAGWTRRGRWASGRAYGLAGRRAGGRAGGRRTGRQAGRRTDGRAANALVARLPPRAWRGGNPNSAYPLQALSTFRPDFRSRARARAACALQSQRRSAALPQASGVQWILFRRLRPPQSIGPRWQAGGRRGIGHSVRRSTLRFAAPAPDHGGGSGGGLFASAINCLHVTC